MLANRGTRRSRTYLVRSFVVTATCVFSGVCNAAPKNGDESGSARPGWAIWSEIQKLAPNIEIIGSTDEWLDTIVKAQASFEAIYQVSPQDLPGSLEYFVDQFGRHGNYADLLWIAADPYLTLGFADNFKKHDNVQYERVHDVISELIVRKIVSSTSFRERYYLCALWFPAVFPNGSYNAIGQLQETFLSDNIEEYWRCARAFSCLAVALNREDLLKNQNPQKLHKQWSQLNEWFTTNVSRIALDADGQHWIISDNQFADEDRPLLPAAIISNSPFPDWKGPALPHHSCFVRLIK